MIGKLTGVFGGASVEGAALVEVGGVGYSVRVPLSVIEGVREGALVALFVHTAVRDDAIDLYGFITEEELAFFKLLTGVSGVGPKSALSILNASDVGSLKRTIGQGDHAALHKIFGIGKKTAERLVVELRDKLLSSTTHPDRSVGASVDAEAIEALTSLGYRLEESREALKALGQDGQNDVRLRLAAALRQLGSH